MSAAQTEDELLELPPEPHLSIDARLILRLLLDETPDHVKISLDLTEPVGWGLILAPETLCADAFADEFGARANHHGTLVVLTEGSTDSEFLKGALELRRPHVAPYVRFLDYQSNRPEGGTAALVKTLKSFAAAGIQNRVVALFDNDAAAEQELTTLNFDALPDHFRVVRLPDLELAKQYPTLGPSGPSICDVNGRACSLEFYLGRDVLTDPGGTLVPVQWSGFMSKIGRYQGELIDKRAVQMRFRSKLARAQRHGIDNPEHWVDLDSALDAVLGC